MRPHPIDINQLMPSKLQDQIHLITSQYRNADNLNARINLHDRFSTNDYDWFYWIYDQIVINNNDNILEIGSGPGDLWIKNHHQVPDECSVLLSDLSEGMIRESKDRLSEHYGKFRFTVIDGQFIPTPNNLFDVVIANHMLYHAPDIRQAISDLCRVMRPGGRFYATTTGENHLKELDELVARFNAEKKSYTRTLIPFTLENGVAFLEFEFTSIEVRRQENSLLVTEGKPLVDFILSCDDYEIGLNEQPALEAFVNQEIEENSGILKITKDSGILICSKPRI